MPYYCTIQGREIQTTAHTIGNCVCFDTREPIIAAERWKRKLLASRQADLIGHAINRWSLIALVTSARKSVVTA